MNKKRARRGFSLIELMVVILMVGILAAVAVPILRGRIEHAKWSEGAASAGSIKTAVCAYYVENPAVAGAWAAQAVSGVAATLGFQAGDLTGRYFTMSKFTIISVDTRGKAIIAVAAPAGLSGSGVLGAAGWIYTP
ncbi:MAG: type II secretion system protein [Planctomycetes bacterium]|nr:type II secretion system protein [Planctomycetota bacterium]